MLIHIIAHAGETHESELVATAHELAWYVQLPLFVLLMAVFASVVWLISKKTDVTILTTSFVLLIAGFGLYQIAPLLSILAITAGLITTLLVTLLGLGGS